MNDYFLLYPLIGIFTGLTSGLLGLGGGLIVVPGLALAFSLIGFPHSEIMHVAAGTSLAVMIATSASAIIAHYRLQNVLWSIVFRILPGILIGVVLGAILASHLSTRWLQLVFGLFLLFVAMKMFFLSKPKETRKVPGKAMSSLIGFLIGIKSGLLGLGGGSIIIPFLTYCNVPMRKASGTSITCSLPISIVGTISFIMLGWHVNPMPHSFGYVYWPAFLSVAFMSLIFAQIGAHFSSKVKVVWLKRLFSLFLLLISLNLLFSAL